MENRSSSGWELLGGLALGALGGFMVGLLVAPKSGGETRDELSGSIGDVRERTNYLLENLRGNTEQMLDSTRAAIEERMELLNEAIEAGRKAAEYKRAELIEREDGSY